MGRKVPKGLDVWDMFANCLPTTVLCGDAV
jgi:hypothetical protein